MSKDDEIRAVANQLDGLLDRLRDNVAAMNEILTRAIPPSEDGERLVTP